MEELQRQDIEDLLQELEEESSTQASSPPDVEELLHILQAGTLYLARRDAAEQLGEVGTSGPRIIRVLRAAAKSLQAPVHKEYLERHRTWRRRRRSGPELSSRKKWSYFCQSCSLVLITSLAKLRLGNFATLGRAALESCAP